MDPGPLSFLIIIICIIFIALLSSSEVAFISLSRIRLRNLIEKGDERAKIAQKIRDEHDKLFSAVILSGNLFTVLATSIGTAVAIDVLGKDVGVVVATVAMTVLTVILCQTH
jgi:putative hemolysin